MPEVTWSEASPSVIHFAENLIRNFHPHLTQARICFVFRNEAQKQGDRFILGQCSKVPDKMKPYFEYDYLIWLSEDDYMAMSDLQREALIDHELCHCKYNFETGGWSIRPHDIQEFSDVIRRHGIWSPDIRKMESAIEEYKQSGLPGSYTVEISGAGKVVTMTGADLERAAKALAE